MTNTAEIDNFIQKLNKILYTYLWDKKERIKRNTLIGKIEWGGIEMLDIQSHFIAITRCTRGVRVVFSVTRMRFNNSARINKSDFTTEKIV